MPACVPVTAGLPQRLARCQSPSHGVFRRFLVLLLLFLVAPLAAAGDSEKVTYIYGTDVKGVTRQLAVGRTPALYTADFGDCLGGQSLLNITKFDAAYYADNMTVLFHLDGTTSVRNESVMLVITMEAYGETRYTQTFDPCYVNMWDLCPLNSSVPIMGYASFPMTQAQTEAIPEIALTIPDFDGYVSVQIFANSSHTEIGCFQAVMTNGNTVSLPQIISPILGVMVLVTMLASFATASYGISVPLMRAHYAHSLSTVLVVEILQSIFLTGALSLHWPSVLVAWWSNFAWSAGLINAPKLVSKIGTFAGISGNASQVGGAGSTFVNNGGGSLAGQIYGRSLDSQIYGRSLDRQISNEVGAELARRKYYNSSDPYDYSWGGDPVVPGMPLPGSWQSFAGTLSDISVPGNSAFTLCLFWMMMALAAFPVILLAVKGVLELLSKVHMLRKETLAYFRAHYLRYSAQIGLRMLLVTFFPVMTMAVFQLTLGGPAGVTALAAVVFILYLAIMTLIVMRAISDRLRLGPVEPTHHDGPTLLFDGKFLPRIKFKSSKGKEAAPPQPQQPQQQLADPENQDSTPRRPLGEGKAKIPSVHQNDEYVKRFGWLVARYRAGCWWFFVVYLFFQLVRACILGGGGADNRSSTTTHKRVTKSPPTAQVTVLLIVDVLVLVLYAFWRPFEGRRNTMLGVWIVGLARVLVTVLCIPLLPQIGISRIGATVIGFVILIVQAVMLLVVLALIVMGVITSWLSLTRNRDDFQSENFFELRQRYLTTLLASATGAPPPKRSESRREKRKKRKAERKAEREAKRRAASMPPPTPTFKVIEVRRAPKIEDLRFGRFDAYEGDDLQEREEELEELETDQKDVAKSSNASSGSTSNGNDTDNGNDSGNDSSGSASGSGESGDASGNASGSSDANGESSTSRGGTADSHDTSAAADNATATHNHHMSTDTSDTDGRDTLGDLDGRIVHTRRRRTISGGVVGQGPVYGGNGGVGGVGPQIYDPGRVIARHNRSRTNSLSSVHSVQSTTSVNRLSGAPTGRARALSSGASGSRYDPTSSFGVPRPLSIPVVPPPYLLAAGHMASTTAGPIADRMTPSRETLARHASERWSLPPPPRPELNEAAPFRLG